jgi:hypothetical protein
MDTPTDDQQSVAVPEQTPQPVLGYAINSSPSNMIIWCRLLAIGMLGIAIERFASFAGYLFLVMSSGMRHPWIYVLSTGAMCVVWPLIAWYCWAQAPRLAARIARSATSDQSEGQPAQVPAQVVCEQMLCVGLLVLAIYQFADAIPELISVLINREGAFHNLSDLPWKVLTAPLVRLGIGAFLICGNHKLILHLRRSFSVPK